MSKAAKSACIKCHHILPRSEMVKFQQTRFSGFSVGQKQKSSRAYFRNRDAWICNDCYSGSFRQFKDRLMNVLTVVVFLLFLIPFLYGMYTGG